MIGDVLRILRVFRDLTLGELAEALGVHTSFLSEVETGSRQPSLDLIEKYAKYFNVRASAILFFAEEMDGNSLKGKTKTAIKRSMVSVYKAIEEFGRDNV